MQTRKQLTLFVPKKYSEIIELVRNKFNPIQKELIDAHITLCREDEIADLEKVIKNLSKIKNSEIKITFGKPQNFSEENGVFLPVKNSNSFDELRSKIISNPRKQIPHITLMHPRNSDCDDKTLKEIQKYSFPKEIIFDEISLIEQENESKWKILKTFKI